MATQGLEYIIKLTDQLSAPLRGVMKSIDDIGKRGEQAMKQIGLGAAGLYATGQTLKAAIDPALEFSRAMKEVEAAGVSASGLNKINQFALEFSSTYGVSATEVVNSANEVVRAIDGLTDSEIIAFTNSSNLLAKATGSNVKEMGSYIATMYGIFQKQADSMGKGKWVQMMAAQATVTANMFKSSGESLSQAFTNLMSTGESKGIALAEQYAVLGNLQSAMPGGNSGTNYAAFLRGVGQADEKLGLGFLDSEKRMLPITEILTKIKNAYGDVIDEAEAGKLKKAFGSDLAVNVITYLLPKIDQLKKNIKDIGNVNSLEDVARIAKVTTDPWMRLSEIIQNVKIAIGTQILAAINPAFNRLADMGQAFVEWLNKYKNIARWIGYIVGAIAGFTALTATFTLMSGVISAISVSFAAILGPVGAVIAVVVALGIVIYKYRDKFIQFINGFIQGFHNVGVSFTPLFNAFYLFWSSWRKIGNAIMKVIAALFGGKDSMMTFQNAGEMMGELVAKALNMVIDNITFVIEAISIVARTFSDVTDTIIEMWQNVITGWKQGDPAMIFGAFVDGVAKIFQSLFSGLVDLCISTINWLIKKINGVSGLVGIEIPLIPTAADTNAVPTNNGVVNGSDVISSVASLPMLAMGVPQNGEYFSMPDSVKPNVGGSIDKNTVTTKLNTVNNNNQVHIGTINVQTNNADDLMRQIKDQRALNG